MLRCEDEPIHLAGAIQPFGALLVCDAAGIISHASANVETWLGSSFKDCLGQNVASVLPGLSLEPKGRPSTVGADGVVTRQRLQRTNKALEISWHRHDGRLLVEIEAPLRIPTGLGQTEPVGDESLLSRLQASTRQLSASGTCSDMCKVLASEVQTLFQYDRVLIYRFDEQWNGTVIAEETAGTLTKYLGHRFPESDIPKQAREVFCLNVQRMIPDARAVAVPLIAKDPAGRAVDLTYCQLRATAEVHLEYLRNLEVGASLTLSLRHGGRLFGLVACHHREARYLSPQQRHCAEILALFASSLLEQKEQQEGAALRTHLDRITAQLVGQMQRHSDILGALCDDPVDLTALNLAARGSCAIRLDGRWRLLGPTPSLAHCEAVAAWLEAQALEADHFASSAFSREWPEAAAMAERASGLLAISLPQGPGSWILWFRPELLQEVHWAGNPHENKVVEGALGKRLHPRQSFDRYREIVRGHSHALAPEEIEAALALRKALIEVDLAHRAERERKLRHVAEAERRRAEEAVAVREHVLNIVSHDLRNPLNAITLSAQLLGRKLTQSRTEQASGAIARCLGNIEAASSRMRRLIEDVLSLSKIQGGQLEVEQAPILGRALLEETRDLLEPIASQSGLSLTVEAPATEVVVSGDRERLLQALSNLVGNAVKFTPTGGQIVLRVQPAVADREALFCVADSGRGIAPSDQARMFDTYWQAEGRQARLGAGLGLSIVKHIVEAHGGRVWVHSEVGKGAEIWFSCPLNRGRQTPPETPQPAS